MPPCARSSRNRGSSNTTSRDDWAKIAGKKGERTLCAPLLSETSEPHPNVEKLVTTGQYL
jgi:hypothetical protein